MPFARHETPVKRMIDTISARSAISTKVSTETPNQPGAFGSGTRRPSPNAR